MRSATNCQLWHLLIVKFPMRVLTAFLIAIVLAAVSARAQDLREKALTHPLDTAYYLLTKDDLDSTAGYPITRALFEAGRFDQALAASKIDDNFHSDTVMLIAEGLRQAKAGDPAVAVRISDRVFEEFLNDDSYKSEHEAASLAELLVVTSQLTKLRVLIDKLEPEQRVGVLTRAALAASDRGQKTSALALLDEVFSLPDDSVDSENDYHLARIAELYLKNGQRERSVSILRRLSVLFADRDDEGIDRFLYRQFYLLGLRSDAANVWKRLKEPNDIRNRLVQVTTLIENRELQSAESILRGVKQDELEEYMVGREIVDLWLKLGKPKVAEDLTVRMSGKPDNYDQQQSFIKIVDHYLRNKDRASARVVLGKAFARVRTIKFEHQPQDSIGASTGSRKGIYLREIRSRYEKLGDLTQALETIRAIDDPHTMAKEYLAAGLARFARDHARKLPRKQVFDLLNESAKIAKETDADTEEVQIYADYAETLAKLRDRDGATNKLAELLEQRKGEYLEGYALIAAAEVFEKYRLPLTDRMRKALSAILDEHDE
jgi:hypothetical protein